MSASALDSSQFPYLTLHPVIIKNNLLSGDVTLLYSSAGKRRPGLRDLAECARSQSHKAIWCHVYYGKCVQIECIYTHLDIAFGFRNTSYSSKLPPGWNSFSSKRVKTFSLVDVCFAFFLSLFSLLFGSLQFASLEGNCSTHPFLHSALDWIYWLKVDLASKWLNLITEAAATAEFGLLFFVLSSLSLSFCPFFVFYWASQMHHLMERKRRETILEHQ